MEKSKVSSLRINKPDTQKNDTTKILKNLTKKSVISSLRFDTPDTEKIVTYSEVWKKNLALK